MNDSVNLLVLALPLALTPPFVLRKVELGPRTRLLRRSLAPAVFLGCVLVAVILHEPVPRVHDEFSYTLMGDTLAHGHVENPSPPLPEFFDTFHVLVHPVYASKYFPAQGIFLAVGEKLTGHPAVGLWLSSALACAAIMWMLEAWISPGWALLGGVLMALRYGVFSYWSQSYWGGMVLALGGALFFGAFRHMWDRFSWRDSIWLALGMVILGNSRPLEGALAAFPATFLFMRRIWRNRLWAEAAFWPKLVVPCVATLALGAFATGAYNKAITGSAVRTPYMLHEQQYQESPPLIFMSMRPKLTYSSPVLQYYYEVQETRLYARQRIFAGWIAVIGRKVGTWWSFYCGVLLSVPLVLPGILKRRTRYWQIALLALIIPLALGADQRDTAARLLLDLLDFGQIVLLWFVFDAFWERLAIGTGALLLFEMLFVKWAFPHYFAPAACLVLYLQVEGMRRIWNWAPQSELIAKSKSRTERRRLGRENKNQNIPIRPWRGVVYLLPVALFLTLVLRLAARREGWSEDRHSPERQALLMSDWSLRRAELEKWMEHQPKPQLVFVRYSPRHNVNFEWVYNHADIIHSHVIWARDLGTAHNRELLKLLPERTVWLLEADKHDPQLVSYSEVDVQAPMPVVAKPGAAVDQDQLDW
jgi:hypothetical protein